MTALRQRTPGPRRRRTLVAAAGVVLALAVTACGSGGSYPATPVPTTTTTPATGSSGAAPTCDAATATQSYAPLASLDTSQVPAAIRSRGKLRVGVSADSQLLGARNPFTGQIEGFDIDIAKAVAKAVFGDENKIQLVVITSADRVPKLKDRSVDMVARNMSMTCGRWQDIGFSAEYYQSGLKLLVPKGSSVTSFAQLKDKKVCAPTGTSTIDFINKQPGVTAVGAATHTACLVLFQQGKVDAIAGDDTVLAGLVAQDPYAFVPKIAAQTSEPYGLGFTKDDVTFIRFTNKLLDDMKADGRWKAIYDRWFAGPLGAAPAPPKSVYGRNP